MVRAGAAPTSIGAGGVCEAKPRDVRPTELTPSSNSCVRGVLPRAPEPKLAAASAPRLGSNSREHGCRCACHLFTI